MDKLIIEETPQTPFISFDSKSGVMEIKGRSIPTNGDDFWLPVINWFETYINIPAPNTVFKIDLEYFNITSSKRILFLLYKLNQLVKTGNQVMVEWYYRESDEDMYEVGEDYKYMIKVPFTFFPYKEPELLAV